MVGKSAIFGLSHSKAPKTQQICHYRHTRKTSELFLLFNTGADFSLCNNFANSGFCAKVSVPIHIYNSLARLNILPELSSCNQSQNVSLNLGCNALSEKIIASLKSCFVMEVLNALAWCELRANQLTRELTTPKCFNKLATKRLVVKSIHV